MNLLGGVQLTLVLVLCLYANQGDGQIACYEDVEDPTLEKCNPREQIGSFLNAQTCCRLPNSVFFESGEACRPCLAYGWTDTFPIEVSKGQVLELNIGYLKGSASGRRRFNVEYDDEQVMVVPDIILLNVNETVQVTVLDDGLPVTEDITITITLIQVSSAGTFDTVYDEAILIIPASRVISVGLDDTSVVVHESEGTTSVCVTATGIDSDTAVNVTLWVISGTAENGVDYVFKSPSRLEMTLNSTRECVDVILLTDNLYEYTETFTLQMNTTSTDNVNIIQSQMEIIILSTDEPTIVLDPPVENVTEGDLEVKSVCLSLLNSAIPVNVTFNEIGLIAGDVSILSFEQYEILSPNGSQTCYTYTVIDDDVIENTEYVIATFYGVGPLNTNITQPAIYTLIITDDDEIPTPAPTTQLSPYSTIIEFIIPTTYLPSPSPSPSPRPTHLPIPQDIADTVSGGALIAALINARSTDTDLSKEISLCYEIHGEPGKYFNFISESCLSVNAHYLEYDPVKPLNFIDEITVVATNNLGENVNMIIESSCNLYFNDSSYATYFYNDSGVLVESTRDYVVIVTYNEYCDGQELVMVIECSSNDHGLMQLHITRDHTMENGIRYHGLLGQFWNILMSIENYGDDPDNYLIEMFFGGNQQRQLVGSMGSVTWEHQKRKCLYVGDRQGSRGAGLHGGPNDPVIEGIFNEYMVDGPFNTDFKYAQFGQ